MKRLLAALILALALGGTAHAWDETCPDKQPGTDCATPLPTTQPTLTTTTTVAPVPDVAHFTG